MKRKLYTVVVFARLSTRRFFRDRTAIFFTVAFPLIFLFVFGGLFGGHNDSSFKVALINQSQTQSASQFVTDARHNSSLKIDPKVTDLKTATDKMSHGQLDATIVLPDTFGQKKAGGAAPTGQAEVLYTQNNSSAAQTLTSVLNGQALALNAKYVNTVMPFTVKATQSNAHSLSSFDYTFSGLLGFSIIGIGIFGPMNVFPELKKQGILRRFHTTPIRTWQYFLSTMISQAIIGLVSMVVQFAVGIGVFHLKVVGNVALLGAFLALGIILILGIGLAVGGWARNERQAAPIANIIVFPMMFLTGTFFPRFLMPDWLQQVTNYLPLTPVIDGIRLIATEGKGVMEILPQLGLIGAWLVIIYAIAFRVFRWE